MDGQGPKALDRVGQQGTLTRVWAPRGTRPRALLQGQTSIGKTGSAPNHV